MTREEALKQIADAKVQMAEASKVIRSFRAEDADMAKTKLELLNKEFDKLWKEAKALANEFHLEFTFEDSEGDQYVEFDAGMNGNWAHSSC